MSSKPFFKRPIFWMILVFVYSIITYRYVKVDVHDEGFARSWYYGDHSSEKNVESAAKFYMENGFEPNAGLPFYNYADTIADNEYVYSHYPPMAEWISGITAKFTNHYSDMSNSVIPLGLSVLLFFMIFYILQKWLQHDIAAFIGASILVLSNYFIPWADDAHQHLYVEFFKWMFLYLWWLYLTTKPKKYFIIILACAYAMMCLFSFEPYVYIAIITVGFPIALKKKIIRWEVGVLLLVPILSFGLRLYLNAQYLGGFSQMIDDMKLALLNRTGRSSVVSELEREMELADYFYLLPKIRFQRLGHFYLFPSIIVVLLSILGILKLRKLNPSIFRITIVIYLACISWVFVMPQHALIHIFTLRHTAIFIGIVMGFGLLEYKNIVVHHWSNRKYLFLLVHIVILGYSLVYISINTVYFTYLKYGFLYPNFGTDNYELFDCILM